MEDKMIKWDVIIIGYNIEIGINIDLFFVLGNFEGGVYYKI